MWCRFPEEETGRSRVSDKIHPALILEVLEEEWGWSVVVAKGTSQHLDRLFTGDFIVEAKYAGTGLTKDTKFRLVQNIRLPYTNLHFIGRSNSPVIGKLPVNNDIGRRFMAAAVVLK